MPRPNTAAESDQGRDKLVHRLCSDQMVGDIDGDEGGGHEHQHQAAIERGDRRADAANAVPARAAIAEMHAHADQHAPPRISEACRDGHAEGGDLAASESEKQRRSNRPRPETLQPPLPIQRGAAE